MKSKKRNQNIKVNRLILEKIIEKKWIIVGSILLAIFYVFLYKIYMPRINAFGCFDDCDNFIGGYFLLQGKTMYSEIFFNHNPFMAYISFLVQYITRPENLYELVLRHRQALMIFSFTCNLLLFFRFGKIALIFALFYELTKFYLFGDRFLAEGFIVYPIIYLIGLAWLRVSSKPVHLFDYIISAIFTWFIIFMREPYVPAAIFLFAFLLWKRKKQAVLALFIFILLNALIYFSHDIKEFYYAVVTVNTYSRIATEFEQYGLIGLGVWKLMFYPLHLLIGGEWGYFRYLLVSLNFLFLASSVFLLIKKQWKLVVLFWAILALLSIRYVVPGKAFYGAFHLLIWYGSFLFMSFVMLAVINKIHKIFFTVLIISYVVIIAFHITSPLSFLRDIPSPHEEFIRNYGIPMQAGIVINSLSRPTDTLFLDGFDDIVYWQANIKPTYQYSVYTGLMPGFERYTSSRIEMFHKSPPDFYYGSCLSGHDPNRSLPQFIKHEYIRLMNDKKPSCVWIRKTKLPSITKQQWQKAGEHHYFLPNSNKKATPLKSG